MEWISLRKVGALYQIVNQLFTAKSDYDHMSSYISSLT